MRYGGCMHKASRPRMTRGHTCRRRPFLVRPLENTLIKLLKTLDFYDDAGRDKLAIGELGLHSSNVQLLGAESDMLSELMCIQLRPGAWP